MAASPDPSLASCHDTRVNYHPPWNDVSIIGVAGSSGSGKSTLSNAIVSALNLPWVVILSMVSLRAPLAKQESLLSTDFRTHFITLLLQSNMKLLTEMSLTLMLRLPLTSII